MTTLKNKVRSKKKELKMAFSHTSSFESKLVRDSSDLDLEFWFIFKDSQLLVEKYSLKPKQTKNLALKHSLYLGKFDNLHIYTGEIFSSPPEDSIWVDLKALYETMDPELYSLAGRALQLANWNRTHQYCGQCGQKTIDTQKERAKECLNCHALYFPKISPVIMALIEKEDQILLARGAHFPKGVYSVLAGFVDSGENLETCIKREVFEEVGLHIENIQYFGSQPWPFPNCLLIAFICRWKSGNIRIDEAEIEDAQWFFKDNLPPLPSEMSISRSLLDAYLKKN